MIIYKEGKIPPVETKIFICKYCDCMFEADSSEYQPITNQMEYLESNSAYKCICPTCGKVVYYN